MSLCTRDCQSVRGCVVGAGVIASVDGSSVATCKCTCYCW